MDIAFALDREEFDIDLPDCSRAKSALVKPNNLKFTYFADVGDAPDMEEVERSMEQCMKVNFFRRYSTDWSEKLLSSANVVRAEQAENHQRWATQEQLKSKSEDCDRTITVSE